MYDKQQAPVAESNSAIKREAEEAQLEFMEINEQFKTGDFMGPNLKKYLSEANLNI